MFLVYDMNAPSQFEPTLQGSLVGLFGIHVDDVIGCGDLQSPTFQLVKEQLHKAFSFRLWEEAQPGASVEYCGCKVEVQEDKVQLHQSHYIQRLKPITIPEERKKQTARGQIESKGADNAARSPWSSSMAEYSDSTIYAVCWEEILGKLHS